MSGSEIPEQVKIDVRAVLLSKIGGVLVSEFRKDYKSLVNKRLVVEHYGFNNFKEFFEAMPDFARLEYSDKDMAFRVFGVGDPNKYMSLSAKKAQGNMPRKPNKFNQHNGSTQSQPGERQLIPNARGLYTVCFKVEKAKNKESDAIAELFSQAGEVKEVNMTLKWIFVRFKTKEGALASLEKLSYLDVRIADEGKSKAKVNEEELSETLLISKLKSPSPTSSHQSGHHKHDKGRGRPNQPKNKAFELFVANIDKSVTSEEFEDFVQELNPTGCKIGRNDRIVFAFVNFATLQEAENGVQWFTGKYFKDRRLQARFANPDLLQSTKEQSVNHATSNGYHGRDGSEDRPHHIVNGNSGHSDSRHEVISQRDTPGPLEPVSNPGPVKSESRSLNFSSGSSSGSPMKLHEKMLDLNIHVDHSGRKMVTSTPLAHTAPKAYHQPSGHDALQNGGHRFEEDDMPQLEDCMPELEESVTHDRDDRPMPSQYSEDNGFQPVNLFVANFPRETSPRELYSLFYRYRVLHVDIVPSPSKCPKAYVLLPNEKMREEAIRDLNQQPYMGRPLLLDIPRFMPQSGPMDNMGHPRGGAPANMHQNQRPDMGRPDMGRPDMGRPDMGRPDMGRPDMGRPDMGRPDMGPSGDARPQRQHPSRMSILDSMCESLPDTSDGRSTTESERTICDLLEIFSHILHKTNTQRCVLRPGNKIKVMVTSAEEETFFWGQIVSDTQLLLGLKNLVGDLQNPEAHLARPKGLGRCAALYEGEWHRAWILKTSINPKDKLKVFFVDYGNVEYVNQNEVTITGPRFWELPPMVQPFSLAGDGVPELGDLENSVVECQVVNTMDISKATLLDVKILHSCRQ